MLCLGLSSEARAHGDLHEQIVAVTRLIAREPRSAVLFHKRGELERAHSDYTAAFRDYDRALELDPSLDVVHLSRGRALLETGKREPAVAALSHFLEKHPGHAGALLLRARARSELGLRAAAEEDFAALFAASSDPSPDLFLERAANLTADEKRAAALAVLEAGIARIGPVITLTHAALDLEVALGRHEAALARLDAMLASAPRAERLLASKARVLDAAGRAPESRAAREEALRLIAALPEAKRGLEATRELEAELRAALATHP